MRGRHGVLQLISMLLLSINCSFGQTNAIPNESFDTSITIKYNAQAGTNSIYWNTDSKIKTLPNHFYILRKHFTESHFTEIGNVLSIENKQEYKFTDTDLTQTGIYNYKILFSKSDSEKAIELNSSIEVNNLKNKKTEIHKYMYVDSTQNFVFLRLISNKKTHLNGGFYDSKGEIIQSIEVASINAGLNELKYDISALKQGNYLMILNIDTEHIIERINI